VYVCSLFELFNYNSTINFYWKKLI
jgi:hypothetical protein